MAKQYPFPFNQSTLEAFADQHLWEIFAPDWTPKDRLPLHLRCMIEVIEETGQTLFLLGNMHQKMRAAKSDFAEDVSQFGDIFAKCLEVMRTVCMLGDYTIAVDPVVLRAVNKERNAKRHGMRAVEGCGCVSIPIVGTIKE